MPRSVQEILDHAQELAARFEDYDPDPSDARDTEVLGALREAVFARSQAERTLADIVRKAHEQGYSWRSIGALLGTSGEAARQKYGERGPERTKKRSA
jgi:hypothetical protein